MKKVKLKKRKNKLRFKRKIVLTSTLVLLFVLGIGYSFLSVNLNILGNILVRKNYGNTLYEVIEKESAIGTYAQEYTEDHQDSMDSTKSTERLFYWKADDDNEANIIQDKWNVLFGGFCWQMIRTTDTGGVKLLYNGVPTDGKCNNFGTNQQIGTSYFDPWFSSLSDVGYMNNTRYHRVTEGVDQIQIMLEKEMNSSGYYYRFGTGATWDSNNNKYTLTGVTASQWYQIYDSSAGLYTCGGISETCSNLYYIAYGNRSYLYGFEMTDGHMENYYNTNITLGSDYSENNGVFTLNNTVTISLIEWAATSSDYDRYYTCGNSATSCSTMYYITNASPCPYVIPSNYVIYSSNFTYDSNTSTYHLDLNDSVRFWDYVDNNNRNQVKNHHYTCFNDTGVCSEISYIFEFQAGGTSLLTPISYINISNGKSVEDALEEMLSSENVNTNKSVMMQTIDSWYESNLVPYTNVLEDVVYCGDRTITHLGGWNPNGGSITDRLEFKSFYNSNTDLNCSSITDKYSVSNSKAQLTYPIGLMTSAEASLMNNKYLLYTNQYYALLSPAYYDGDAYIKVVNNGGNVSSRTTTSTTGVRPVIALRPGTEYISGTGSKEDPYVVNTFIDDDWDTIINNIRNGNTANYQVGDTKEIDMGSFGTHTLRIANKSTPSECNNSDFSETACGFVLEFADILSLHRMNPTSTNVGGWPATEMRTYVNTDIYNALPSDLKNGIINTRVVSGHGSSDSNNFTSTDKLYLQTIKELNGVSVMDSAAGKTRQLDYYNNLGIRNNDIRVARKLNGNYRSFNLRGMTSERSIYYYAIDATGMWESNGAAVEKGVSPAFRIG